MPLPKQQDIEIPLLRALEKLGGSAPPRDVYPIVQSHFPDITEAELAEKVGGNHSKWKNRVQWARQKLIDVGEMESGGRGIWNLTDKGRKRIRQSGSRKPTPLPVAPLAPVVTPPNLSEIWDEYVEAFKRKTLERLLGFTPHQFERFAREYLEMYGFINVEVTGVGPDGGIDGHGSLRVGVATMRVAFQCKRWQGNVPRKQIDEFRGATQGAYEQGIFFTTADFTKGAREVSIRRGAIPIILINGRELVNVMMANGFGIMKRPLFVFEESAIPGVDDLDQD